MLNADRAVSSSGNRLKLLMTNTSPEMCQLCQEALPLKGIDVVVCARNGAAVFAELVRHRPQAALLDVFMPGMDALEVKARYEKKCSSAKTKMDTDFYGMGTFQRDDIENDLMQNGFLFFYIKPFDVNLFAQRLLERHNGAARTMMAAARQTFSVEGVVTEMLYEIGVPPHVKGYRFLRDAILMVVEEPRMLDAVTKELYPAVATKNKALKSSTSASQVERSIRHAIDMAFDRGDPQVLYSYFGATIHSMRGKPTNSEFIAMLSDRCIRMKNSSV